MPMNGASGTSTPGAKSATLRWRSSRMSLSAGSRRRSGAAPRPGPVTLAPYGTRISTSSMRTSSMSPGRAPSTYTGPVSTCGPGALLALHPLVYLDRVGKDFLGGDARAAEVRHRVFLAVDPLMRDRVDAHALPGIHAQDRLPVGGDPAPAHRFRRRTQHRIGFHGNLSARPPVSNDRRQAWVDPRRDRPRCRVSRLPLATRGRWVFRRARPRSCSAA